MELLAHWAWNSLTTKYGVFMNIYRMRLMGQKSFASSFSVINAILIFIVYINRELLAHWAWNSLTTKYGVFINMYSMKLVGHKGFASSSYECHFDFDFVYINRGIFGSLGMKFSYL